MWKGLEYVYQLKERRIVMKNPFDAIGEAIGEVIGKIVEAIAGDVIKALVQGFIDALFKQDKKDDEPQTQAE